MPSENKSIKKPQPIPARSKQAAHPTENPAPSSTSLENSPSSAQTNPLALTPATMLHLQRTIGNQAVLRMLAQQNDSVQRQVAVHETGAPTIQRKIRSYADFIKYAKKLSLEEGHFEHNLGNKTLGRQRPENFFGANVLRAYDIYEKDKSTANLVNLFDTITYWEALNTASTKEAWFKPAKAYLDEVKEEIRKEIRVVTKESRQPIDKQSLKENKEGTELRGKIDAVLLEKMPPFLRNVGLAPHYYRTYLDYNQPLVNDLKSYYDALEAGNLGAAEMAYMGLEKQNVPALKLIQPLFVAHFAGKNKKLGKVFDTKSQPGVLTDDEIDAIEQYTGGKFDPMNAQLRNAAKGKDRKKDLNDLIKNVLSGLNKLPAYSGIAYRGLGTLPEGYFDVVQPGAMVVDLAFQSASPSMKGVDAYNSGASKPGTKNIFFVIQTKSAVNVMKYALSGLEGEILFKPGVKFRVKAIWQHIGNSIPPNAPAEVQMILHSKGKFTTEEGYAQKKIEQIANNPNPRAAETAILARNPGNQKNPIKVIEMVEV